MRLTFIIKRMNFLPAVDFPFLYFFEQFIQFFLRNNLSAGVFPVCVKRNFSYFLDNFFRDCFKAVVTAKIDKSFCTEVLDDFAVHFVRLSRLVNGRAVLFLADIVVQGEGLCVF